VRSEHDLLLTVIMFDHAEARRRRMGFNVGGVLLHRGARMEGDSTSVEQSEGGERVSGVCAQGGRGGDECGRSIMW